MKKIMNANIKLGGQLIPVYILIIYVFAQLLVIKILVEIFGWR